MNFNVRARKSLRAARYMRRATSVSGIYAAKSGSRMSRYSRVSRTNSFTPSKGEEFRIRKSLADCVREELDAQGRALFHQRIVIVAKNPNAMVQYTIAPAAPATPKKTKPQVEHTATSSQRQTLLSILSKRSIFSSHSFKDFIKGGNRPADDDDDDDDEKTGSDGDAAQSPSESSSELDFKTKLRDRLLKIQHQVHKDTFTTDQLNGLCLCMGEYTLLMLEGADDLVGEFCTELGEIANELWTVNRVLQVQDRIDEHRYCSPININEKFPTATPNDEYLMAQQHCQLVEKTHSVCEAISKDVSEQTEMHNDHFHHLHAEQFNKLLPEVQRLELVLQSTRFYRDVREFATIFWRMPIEQDDDALVWPVPYEFTPLGVFVRSPFDVNLTFADYEHVDDQQQQQHSELTEGEGSGAGSEPH